MECAEKKPAKSAKTESNITIKYLPLTTNTFIYNPTLEIYISLYYTFFANIQITDNIFHSKKMHKSESKKTTLWEMRE